MFIPFLFVARQRCEGYEGIDPVPTLRLEFPVAVLHFVDGERYDADVDVALAWKVFPNGIHALGSFARMHRVPQDVSWRAFVRGVSIGEFETFADARTAIESAARDAGFGVDSGDLA
jgi:hypothetical protein